MTATRPREDLNREGVACPTGAPRAAKSVQKTQKPASMGWLRGMNQWRWLGAVRRHPELRQQQGRICTGAVTHQVTHKSWDTSQVPTAHQPP